MATYNFSSLREISDYSLIKTLTQAISIAVGAGTVLVAGLVAPNAVQILKPFLKDGRRAITSGSVFVRQ